MPNMSVSSYQNINMSNVNNFSDMLQLFNTSGAGYLFVGIDFMIFFILLLTFSISFGFETAFLTAGFSAFVIGLLFNYMGVMSLRWVGVFLGVIIVGILIRVYNRNG